MGTAPTARAECGFTAVGDQLFVFGGQYIAPGQILPGQIRSSLFRIYTSNSPVIDSMVCVPNVIFILAYSKPKRSSSIRFETVAVD